MRFSLIIGTLGRSEALKQCLSSLEKQEWEDYEVIVIDQSRDDDTEELVKKLDWDKLKYHHVDFVGLSKARNLALKYSQGDYICLIDDDAYYAKDYLRIADENIRDEKTIYSGYIWDTIKKDQLVNYDKRYDKRRLPLRRVIRTCPSAGLVIPAKMVEEVGGFDERLGVGGVFGAAEETDLILRGMKKGYRVVYLKNLRLKHPVPIPTDKDDDKEAIRIKMKAYHKGFGALYKKHLFYRHSYELIFCYLEIWIKLIIKRIYVRKFDRDLTKAQINGWCYGLKHYKENGTMEIRMKNEHGKETDIG